MIRHYTHEAGVRSLEREIQNIARKMARKVVTDSATVGVEITPANANDFLGVLKYREYWLEKHNEIGLTTGLAWTEVGGSVLVTEAAIMEGKGRLTPTGQTRRSHARVRASRHELHPLAFRGVRPD